MLPLDADELYDLPDAGRRLHADPVRLARWIRRGRIPGLYREGGLAVPRAWVDAATGATAADADALCRYWLERLAPAPREARRPSRDRSRLPATELLSSEDAARRLCADARRLARLDREGAVPALRVDGETVYDAGLLEQVDGEAPGAGEAAPRREAVRAWSRFEYVTGLEAGAPAPDTEAPAAPPRFTAVAPGAWHVPDDLPSPGERPLIEADGYDVEEEDP